MGDTAVDFFLETLQHLITSSNLDFILEEKHQLQSLGEEIKYLRWFLTITEKKRNEHSEVMKLVKQIRDVVSEAENIVELFVDLVSKVDLASNTLREHQDQLSIDLERVRKEITNLTAEVKQIYKENMYDMNGKAVKRLKHSSTGSGGGSSSLGGSNAPIEVKEKVVIGFEEEVKRLIDKLDDRGDGRQLEIITIIGAGGGGKTTLAREVYDHRFTSYTFDILAWVDVSQYYDKTMKKNLLIRILESASARKDEDYKQYSEDKLGEMVHKFLKGRKYLIVMDDIWGIEPWNDIQRSFPKECRGSKVLFTSRLLVQPDSVRCVPHYLDPLSESCSWELLQKKVFGNDECSPNLVDIGKQIAEKCKGLPLAIVAIAGILATEDKTLYVWEEVAKHLSSIIAKNQEGCMEILELSYNHLPLHLKACFLYIAAHPEDYEIAVRELIWLWIGEGFIQQSEVGESLEDIAKDYLIGLIDRSLIMVARKSKSRRGIKTCRIHDLLRELGLKKAEEDNFIVKIYEDDPLSPSSTNKQRRLFISSQFFHKFSSRPRAQNLRSFMCLSLSNSPPSKQNLSFFVENFKLLKVLNFRSATSLGEIRKGDLVHLRYLSLRIPHDLKHRAPLFIHYLSNLVTLNLQVGHWTKISLPLDILKMVHLRHLYTRRGIFEYHVSYDYEEEGNMLDSLLTLHRICLCEHCHSFLRRTPNLKELGLTSSRTEDRDVMLRDLEFLKCLETLVVEPWMLTKQVTGLKLPPTLTRLTFKSTDLKWEELSIILQTLPSLGVLKLLYSACWGAVWDTTELEEGFSQLKYLKFEQLHIEEWNASADQFPRLEVLEIEWCEYLKGIPLDFANLYDLREIKLFRCSQSAEESVREIQEEQKSMKGDDDWLNFALQPLPEDLLG
ncbi:putative late blight resistance protein homolog R1A-10 isoform X2 [Rhododendron vialii]|uniref:putative late blight resistance protein homolog R1A-10 isoform X2 n=1 Tax=Rhododendron vialii TaxID=182163 RepID=UPI00265F28D1|nr:putative late blight resistance protein homolog R1A-10 isoform X2 [Rhododendron vialii]